MTLIRHRHERLAEEIRQEVGSMLEGELKDPRLATAMTVTEVRVSPDLKRARIFVSVQGTQAEEASTMAALEAAAGYIRHELAERLQIRRSPEVEFRLDRSEQYAQQIDKLLRKAKEPEGFKNPGQ